ncbi:MAG: hypothetical protein KGH87_09585 [Thaumarchaeota archaeon]|nr:hypothetical protein [Nitrososphaerota archaeon]MDE1840156.1 hypothetical protein [Nitrososphaerota archaeon]
MDRIDLQVQSMRGTALLHEITRRSKDREDVILKKLVAACESGKMSHEQMRDGIAGIAALRALIRDIERDVKVATDESRQLSAEEGELDA